jgi:hypothetical protein
MDNYSKYQKYKFKYLKLKNQMGGDPTEVTNTIGLYTKMFKEPKDIGSIEISKHAEDIFRYIYEGLETIDSVKDCIISKNCYNDPDIKMHKQSNIQRDFYHSIFFTVYYIINNLPEDKTTKDKIKIEIKFIVFFISMSFWAYCNPDSRYNIIDKMQTKISELLYYKSSDETTEIHKYINNIKDFAIYSIKPYINNYTSKILKSVENFNMKINILVLINIFNKIFTEAQLKPTYKKIFKDDHLIELRENDLENTPPPLVRQQGSRVFKTTGIPGFVEEVKPNTNTRKTKAF